MNNRPWIAEAGFCGPENTAGMISRFVSSHSGCRYIAFYTDRFISGWEDTIPTDAYSTLLEIRIFKENAECHLFRTSIADDFRYRVADDDIIKHHIDHSSNEDPFLKEPENYRIVTHQVLDIDNSYAPYKAGSKNANGCRFLRTTGGGLYTLPLNDEDDLAIVVDYLEFDNETGVARAVDHRLAGFASIKGGDLA